ncbi:MAG: S8 family serine peptidase [Caulobacter sp.]|nr:S8 family serine peptidase [Caulobacter sp.]
MTVFVMSRVAKPALCVLAAALPLAACGGGGGGGGPATTVVAASPPPVSPPVSPPPPPPPPAYPTTSSAEFQKSWSLASIHADSAYAKGATGQGATVAVIDSGVDSSLPDLAGALSPASTDLIAGRSALVGTDRHGTRVADIIASRFNGSGTLGVAYGSTILSIRADDASNATPDCSDCVYGAADLARGIDYAVANGAKVINLSLGGDTPLGAAFEAALSRAVAAGTVIAVSSGNEGAANPDWPARYAVDSRYVGSIIAVGALTQSGTMASYSNKAGVAAEDYLAAPGDKLTVDCLSGSCWQVSGTSFASPQVAGALALLLQAFPNISGRDAVDILLRTAADLGAAGTDSTYGRGGLDLNRAFQPVGTSSLSLANGSTATVTDAGVGATVAQAFGASLHRTQALRTVIRDDYRRLFEVDLADGLPGQRRSGLIAAPPVQAASQVVLGGPSLGGFNLAVSVEGPVFDERANEPTPSLTLGEGPMRSVRMQAAYGRLSLSTWSGEGGAQAPAGAAGRDAFQLVAQPDRTTQGALRLGRFALLAEQGSAHPRMPWMTTQIQGSRYVSATGMMQLGSAVVSLTGGALDEPLGPLGSYLTPGSALALPASTRFGAAALDLYPVQGLNLHADLSMGRTAVDGALIDLNGAISSAWRLAAVADCGLVGWSCSRLSFEVAQPLRIEGGRFQATLADVPVHYDDPLTFSTRRFSAAPDGREIDLSLGLEKAFGALRTFSLRTRLSLQPGHDADAPPAVGAIASWRSRF